MCVARAKKLTPPTGKKLLIGETILSDQKPRASLFDLSLEITLSLISYQLAKYDALFFGKARRRGNQASYRRKNFGVNN